MTILDDHDGASTAEISDELIFLIASAATDEQRKYAADLFRYFARQVALDAYRHGQQSVATSAAPSTADPIPVVMDDTPATQPDDDHPVSLVPPVRFGD
jgi:hypothetical protein